MGQYSNWRFSVCLSVCLWGTLFRIFRISTMQQPFYGTHLLACTRRPLQPHFSFFSIVHQYSNWRFSVCLCVCVSVGNAFSHFSDFDDATAFLRYPPARMHPPTASTPFFVFFRSYINTLI